MKDAQGRPSGTFRGIAAGCAAILTAWSLATPAVAAGDAPPFSNGLLWKIARKGTADSYVFGTIHLADPRVTTIARPVGEAFARSRVVATELGSGTSDAEAFAFESFDDGRRLEPLIGRKAFEQLRWALAARDVTQAPVDRLKPWAAMMRIALARARGEERSLDEMLVDAARAQRKQVIALESAEDQVYAFDAIPLDSQVALLQHALAHPDALAAAAEPTIDAWLRRDLAAIVRIGEGIERKFPELARHHRELVKHIIHDRTAVMHYRLFIPLRAGGVFVAMGASHLSGPRGLLALLRQDGYRVTRIW